MYIERVRIKNFRLLRNVELNFEEKTTVIVGRNNSGKTSLAELFRRLLTSDSPTFELEDFSLSVHERFWNAFQLHVSGEETETVREALPLIEISLHVNYAKNLENYGPLGEFIVDVNPSCTEALIIVQYRLKDGKIKNFFEDLGINPNSSIPSQKAAFFRDMKERIPKLFGALPVAVDPADSTNRKTVEWIKLRTLIQSGFVNAHREVDDTTHKDQNVLGKILQMLFETTMAESNGGKEHVVAKDLETAIQTIQQDIDENFNGQLSTFLPAMELFGYPGLTDPGLRTETSLNVAQLLKSNTKVKYSGENGVNLPESYNGLGSRNLIYILLKLFAFFKAYRANPIEAGTHLIFIEEPEAHLHPQMQEVFIGQLDKIGKIFEEVYNAGKPWPVQFVVSTHSSHMANRARFDSMRYFLSTPIQFSNRYSETKVKDLRKGMGGIKEEDQEFLHQYMTLTRCDLLFADKAILIEGTSERLLLPKMIEKVDEVLSKTNKLGSQYISVVEVGGAYAHIFFKLLDFLELITLVITDIDAVDGKKDRLACLVSQGTDTSNASIKAWFKKKSDSKPPILVPYDLIKRTEKEKTKGVVRIAYQIPESAGMACGRSLEASFILANLALFGMATISAPDFESEASKKAEGIKKSSFALQYAITDTTWKVPKYLYEGLQWLGSASKGTTPTVDPSGKQGNGMIPNAEEAKP